MWRLCGSSLGIIRWSFKVLLEKALKIDDDIVWRIKTWSITMRTVAAKEAGRNFPELIDTVKNESIVMQEHGKPSAVLISSERHQKIKLEKLRARLAEGERQADQGAFVNQTVEEMLNEFKSGRNE